MAAENNKRIAKNTLLLYFRMLVIMSISLYTSRIVLNILGVVDYGIYNVVGGVVSLIAFLNSAMAGSTQRFLSYEIGRGDKEQLKNVFSHSIVLHLLIAALVFLLAETIGLWFVETKLNIPEARRSASLWVYQRSVLACVITMVQVPFNSVIIARERMHIYAYISFVEALFKLLMVYALRSIAFDSLKTYAILTVLGSAIIAGIYRYYCIRNFEECHFAFRRDNSLLRSLLNFSGWNLCGSFAWVIMNQGVNILLNIFFGPIVNASRGIAAQVNNALSGIVSNLLTAVSPQIVKAHASGKRDEMIKLVFETAKFSHYLLLLFCIPVIFEAHTILRLWLKIVPNYAVSFCRLTLINTLILNFDTSISAAFQAMGKIKYSQLISGITYVMILPISFLTLKSGKSPDSVFVIQIIATFIVAFFGKVFLLLKTTNVSLKQYLQQLILPVVIVSLLAICPPLILVLKMPESLMRVGFVSTISVLSIIVSVYSFGVTSSNRKMAKTIMFKKFGFKTN